MTKKQFKLLRGLIGLNQGKLAKEMGVTIRTVLRWERGEFPIPRVAELAIRNLFRESLRETVPWEKIKKELGLEPKTKKQ
jgi:transcriptional regulator with XRE-family HTH domain